MGMNDVTEFMYLRQMMGGDAWVHAVFLAGVFLAVLFRRDQIVSPYMFRVSLILFVLSFVVPAVMTTVVVQRAMMGGRMGGGFDSDEAGVFMHVLMMGAGPALFGISVVLCILSMLPLQSRYPQPPSRPREPHPLD
jgi:hypothetical protein